ncbi:MAG: hypothetical protein PHE89_02430 [Alphaproteobacteria bacterium]|nr:hypothetical protein [Alphaproteobacteria bacterium]
MLKGFLLNLVIITLILLAYQFNFFALFSENAFIIGIFIIIAVLFAVAFKVLGNPFKK